MRVLPFLVVGLLTGAPCGASRQTLATDYTVITKNRKYLFVMLAPTYQFGGRLSKGVHYPHSGLYPNNGTIRPIWKVDWYASSVDVSSDGRHLIRWSGWLDRPEDREAIAVAFYRDGKEIKRYSQAEVIRGFGDPNLSAKQFALLHKNSFDDRSGRAFISIPTDKGVKQPRRLTFDVRTGLILAEKRMNERNPTKPR